MNHQDLAGRPYRQLCFQTSQNPEHGFPEGETELTVHKSKNSEMDSPEGETPQTQIIILHKSQNLENGFPRTGDPTDGKSLYIHIVYTYIYIDP